MRRAVLLAVLLLFPAAAGSAPRSVVLPILEYHRIGPLTAALPAITRRLTVAPAEFAAQMRWLVRHGYHAVSQRQAYAALEDGAPLPPHPVMITFDDGYRDVLWRAAPVLRRLRWPATEYVITDRISDGGVSFLTWPELRQLERLGFAIGSHTVHHTELTSVSPAAALHELVASRRILQQHLHRPVRWFCYPAGRFDAQDVRLVHRAGYELAVTEQPGDVQSAAAPLELHRDEILDTTRLSSVLSG